MAGFNRSRQEEDVIREISAIMRQLKDPRVAGNMVSIVRGELSGDGSHCKLYISCISGMEKAKEACRGLDSASGLIKREVANRLHLRKCPELHFIADDSIEASARLNKMITEAISHDAELHNNDNDGE